MNNRLDFQDSVQERRDKWGHKYFLMNCIICGKRCWKRKRSDKQNSNFCSVKCSKKHLFKDNQVINGKKKCTRCRLILPLYAFFQDRAECKICHTINRRYKITRIEFQNLLQNQKFRCRICGDSMRDSWEKFDVIKDKEKFSISIDHIISKSHRGKDNIDNYQLVHLRCNILKQNLEMDQLIIWCDKVISKKSKESNNSSSVQLFDEIKIDLEPNKIIKNKSFNYFQCKSCGKKFWRNRNSSKIKKCFCSSKCRQVLCLDYFGVVNNTKRCVVCLRILSTNAFLKRKKGNRIITREKCKCCQAIESIKNLERIDFLKLLNKQNLKCNICLDSMEIAWLNPSILIKNDPLNLSIDHIIPLAKNGENLMTNYQLTHKICNLMKHDNTMEELQKLCKKIIKFHNDRVQ